MRYTICHWATNRTDPQNLLSTSLDVPLQSLANCKVPLSQGLYIEVTSNHDDHWPRVDLDKIEDEQGPR